MTNSLPATAPALPTDQPVTWVCCGDSITQGVVHTHGERNWVELLSEHIRWVRDRTTDLVINSGVSGWTAPQALAEFDWLIGRHEPRVVHLSFATNDALRGLDGLTTFHDALNELICRSKDLGADVVLHTPAMVSPGASTAPMPSRKHIESYSSVIRDLALTHSLILVDHERFWLSHFDGMEPYAWLDDWVHPNAAGHRAMADLTIERIAPLLR